MKTSTSEIVRAESYSVLLLVKQNLISTYHLSSIRLECFHSVLQILQSVKSCLPHMALNSTFIILAVWWICKPIILSY